MIHLMIVEDNDIVRKSLIKFLDREKGIKVHAEASNGKVALEQLAKGAEVDVVMIDWNMPDMDGLELTQLIKTQFANIKVIILTMHGKQEYMVQSKNAGAAAYLLKDMEIEDIGNVIRAVSSGATFL